MAKYFLSCGGVVWAWKDGESKLWSDQDPVWTNAMGKYTEEDLMEDEFLTALEPDEAKEITGGLPTW